MRQQGIEIAVESFLKGFNDGQTGAPNHRFVRSLAIYNEFTTSHGWTGEGIRLCSYEPLF